MDYEIMYGPIYDTIGVSTKISLLRGDTVTVTALDKTAGVQVDHLETLVPAATVRYPELIEKRVEAKELVGATVFMNGFFWECYNYKPRPSPLGELAGEVYLFLRNKTTRRET